MTATELWERTRRDFFRLNAEERNQFVEFMTSFVDDVEDHDSDEDEGE